MTDQYRIISPVRKDTRTLYHLVRIRDHLHDYGGWIDATPIAILIEENGKWSFIALEEGITEEVIHLIHGPEKE